MTTNIKKWTAVILALLVATGIGYSAAKSVTATSDTESAMYAETYTCSMHPQIKKNEPGKCPICGMNLIPVHEKHDDKDTNNHQIVLSKKAETLAEVAVSPVIREFAEETLRLSGKLMVDETRSKTVTARFPGRIEKLFIDYSGLTVEKNTPMATLYSPELLVAQKELLEATRTASSGLLNSSKQKLRLWGLSNEQIQAIIRSGNVSDTLTLRSPIGGTVLTKYVKEGEYLSTGSKLYDIASLDQLWLIADVYESDAAKLRNGQSLEFTTLTYPGRSFSGSITFIDPTVNPTTRTIRIRAIVDNKNRELKPEMLAKASVKIRYGLNGPVQEATSSEKPLLIPATAPLITGKRAVVYVQIPGKRGVYEGREIHLGPKVGDFYVVHNGLSEGDYVVTKGNFKIDSAMQIQAKPSMMQQEGGKAMSGHRH